MPIAAIAIPAVAGLIGAHEQASAQEDAAKAAANAAQFRPYGINGPLGRVSFDTSKNIVNAGLTTEQNAQRNSLGQLFSNLLGGNTPTSGYESFANALGNVGLPGLFGNAITAANTLPTDALSAYHNGTSDVSSLLNSTAQGLLSGAATNPNAGTVATLTNQGLGAINTDTSGIINNTLNLLRQQAAPQESQAYNSLQNKLFSQGRLGSTGGSRDIQAFAQGLGQADLARQLQAQQLGLQIQGQNANIGMGLLGQAQGLQSLDLNRAQNMQALAPQLLGLQSQILGNQYQSALGINELGNSRAQQNMQNAMSLFGFGNSINTQNFNQALSSLQGQESIDTGLRNLIALGGNLGNASGSQQAVQAQALLTNNSSPLGAFLSGIGNGALSSAMSPYAYGSAPSSGLMPITLPSNVSLMGNYAPVQTSTLMQLPNYGGL